MPPTAAEVLVATPQVPLTAAKVPEGFMNNRNVRVSYGVLQITMRAPRTSHGSQNIVFLTGTATLPKDQQDSNVWRFRTIDQGTRSLQSRQLANGVAA